MKSVKILAQEIVTREGGYVNDPDDPGGATNLGVTIGTLRRLGVDLDGDGHVTTRDLRKLSAKQAVEIYMEHYFKRPRINELPEVLHPSVFDMYVNSGANAVKILQRLLRKMGYAPQVDGVIGPQTIDLSNAAFHAAPHHLADAYSIERRNYYYALADARPRSRKYARRRSGGKGGWIKRAEEFMDPRYHLTQTEHAERIAKWG